jgi:hypothetical protein
MAMLLAVAGPASLRAQTLAIPYHPAPVSVDGNLQASEWAGARQVYIRLSAEDSIAVLMKHDMAALYLAFSGNLESANALFPEVLLDPQLSRGNSWVDGQWWLHVSATDCEHNGAYGIYTNCKLVQPGWEAGPNFSSGPPATDTVELRIPFNTIGFNPMTQDTMGFALLATNTVSIWRAWPAAADRNIPATWCPAVLSKPGAGALPAVGNAGPALFPNPATTSLTVARLPGAGIAKQVVLTDAAGRVCYRGASAESSITVPVSGLPAGLYFLSLRWPGAYHRCKVIKGAE